MREIFFENGTILADNPGAAKHDYYGGTYLEGGTQVILLTDLSHVDEFTGVGENIRFEKCDYTYSELKGAMEEIWERRDPMAGKGEGYAKDVISSGISDKENRIHVTILNISDEKIKWFKENLCDADYIIFDNTDTLPQDTLDDDVIHN